MHHLHCRTPVYPLSDDCRTAATTLTEAEYIAHGRRVIELECAALKRVAQRLDARFALACGRLIACQGRVVVVGMGKSGHIGGKLASTLASTGTPAFFVHPGEASHGDLGMITPGDLVVALSNSGETPEVLAIVPIVKRMGVALIALTGWSDSTLARLADVSLDIGVEQEACPLNLAPTASTTAALAMGDALAIAALSARGFSRQDFARTHPGGTLGRRRLLYASDIMHTGERVPLIGEHAPLADVLLEVTSKSLGMTGVLDDDGRLAGIFTDGDLRRLLHAQTDLSQYRARDAMTRDPFTIGPEVLAAEIVHMMREHALHGPHAINGVFVVDRDGRVVGALNTHDLLRASVL